MAGIEDNSVDRTAEAGACGRTSGTQPRNRQHRVLEYYFGRKLTNFSLGTSALKVAERNPYRTQLTFSGFLSSAAASIYIEPQILSWPTHGPLVTEEWWAVFDGCPAIRLGQTQADSNSGLFSLNVPVAGGGQGFNALSATLQVGEYYYSD